MLIRPVPTKRVETKEDSETCAPVDVDSSNEKKPLLGNNRGLNWPIYLMIFIVWFAIRSTDTVMLVDTPFRAKGMGLTKTQAALLLSIYGGAQALTCIPWGFLGDRKWFNETVGVAVAAVVCGGSMWVSAFYTQFQSMAFHSVIYGIGAGEIKYRVLNL